MQRLDRSLQGRRGVEWGWREVSSILCRGSSPAVRLGQRWLLPGVRRGCAGELIPEAAAGGLLCAGEGEVSAERQRLVSVRLQGRWAGVGLVLVFLFG